MAKPKKKKTASRKRVAKRRTKKTTKAQKRKSARKAPAASQPVPETITFKIAGVPLLPSSDQPQ